MAAEPAPNSARVTRSARVLSIQSSVVYGYVGNRSAVLPLQLLGIEVDPLNSVQLSNHTGYARFSGNKFEGAELDRLVEGLDANGFLAEYSHVLTGYIGTESFLQRTVELVKTMKAKRPDLVYVCDPVMGDDGRLYVPRAFVDVFRNQLVPLAGVLTPNQTEAELLSGIAIRSLEDAQRVLCALHAAGPQVIVIKSLALRDGFIDVVASSVRGERRRADGAPLEFYHMQLPRFAGYYSGTGDLASALLLGNLERFAGDLTAALEHSMASVRAILTRTVQLGRKELALVQSRADIEVAPVEFRASALPNRL